MMRLVIFWLACELANACCTPSSDRGPKGFDGPPGATIHAEASVPFGRSTESLFAGPVAEYTFLRFNERNEVFSTHPSTDPQFESTYAFVVPFEGTVFQLSIALIVSAVHASTADFSHTFTLRHAPAGSPTFTDTPLSITLTIPTSGPIVILRLFGADTAFVPVHPGDRLTLLWTLESTTASNAFELAPSGSIVVVSMP